MIHIDINKMASSKSIQSGQVPVVCNLCETETKINWKCLECDLLMCTKCKEKVHSKIKTSKDHMIIDIKEVGAHSKDVDFRYLRVKCREHEDQTCFMFCKSCEELVCPTCIAKVHNGHQFAEISEGYHVFLRKMKANQKVLVANTDTLTKGEENIEEFRGAQKAKYMEVKNLILSHNAALKNTVDKHTDKLLADLDDMWHMIEKDIDTEVDRVKSIKEKLLSNNSKIDAILSSKGAEMLFVEYTGLEKSMNKKIQPVKLNFSNIPKFLPGEITVNNIGSLHTVSSDFKLNIIEEFPSEFKHIFDITANSDGSLWINDNDKIQKLKPYGKSMKKIISEKMKIFGISKLPSNDLLVADYETVLKQLNTSTGKVKSSIYNTDPLKTTTVHVSKDGKIFIGARETGPPFVAAGRKVVMKLNIKGQQEMVYEFDKNRQNIFTYVEKITTTSRGNIFVIDRMADDHDGRAVILGHTGDILHFYNGCPTVNSQSKPFKPLSCVTTPSDNVIIPEKHNSTIHILNNMGHLMTYCVTKDIGIEFPYCLSYTSSGQVYIGCATLVDNSDKAKIYKVDVIGD